MTVLYKITALIMIVVTVCACGGKVDTSEESVEPTIPILSVSLYNSPLIDYQVAADHPYDLSFTVEAQDQDNYLLHSSVDLFGGSFYVSPFSTREFKGKFTISIEENDKLVMGEEFTETPRSEEVIDLHQFIDGKVNWVMVDTHYEHPISLTTTEDFELRGKYIFTIEPKCTLEEIPFIIKYKNGVLKIEKWLC